MPLDRALVETLAGAIVPECRELSPEGRQRLFAIVEDALSARPPEVRRQLLLFMKALRWLPLLRFGARLDRLPPSMQERALRFFEEAPLAPLRQGFWGVKTLVFMGYYGQPEVAEALGYRPAREGNDRLSRRGIDDGAPTPHA